MKPKYDVDALHLGVADRSPRARTYCGITDPEIAGGSFYGLPLDRTNRDNLCSDCYKAYVHRLDVAK